MSEPTLYNALKDIADAIRAKGVTGTMSAIEMPQKIASIPTGGYDAMPLAITALNAPVDISSTAVGSPSQRVLEYSTDNGQTWSAFTLGSTTVTLANVGDKMLMRGTNSTIANTWQNYWKMTFSEDVDVSGNLNSLLGGSSTTISGSLYGLFDGQTHLINASSLVLPWTTLQTIDVSPTEAMFRNCTNLIGAPRLPATTLSDYCYKSMFQGCSSLTTAPELPATTLTTECYNTMFSDCTSLTTPPSVLPATNAASASCYQNMFYGCTALTTTPDIKVVNTTGTGGMINMFRDCTSLVTVKLNDLESARNGRETFAHVFQGCTSLKEVTLPKLSYIGNQNYCMTECFNGCSSLEEVYMPSLTTVINGSTLRFCFTNCPSLTYVDMGTIATIQSKQTMDWIFANDVNLSVVDFSKATAVPQLSNVNAFNNTNSTFKIVVPDALYDQWIVASNWSNFASQIVKASEYVPAA